MNRPRPTPTVSLWPCFAAQIVERLTSDDDPALWRAAVETVIGGAERACKEYGGKGHIFVQVGRCSHWLAPHKARWITADGEFTWPSGYQGKTGFFGGLPEFDWCLFWIRDKVDGMWRYVPDIRAKRPLLLRIAVPARTRSRLRASVHAMWAPGPRAELNLSRLFYGFRRVDSVWKHRAYRGPSEYRARTSACTRAADQA